MQVPFYILESEVILCKTGDCLYSQACANHVLAGTEDGFTPRLKMVDNWAECKTMEARLDSVDGPKCLPEVSTVLGRSKLMEQH